MRVGRRCPATTGEPMSEMLDTLRTALSDIRGWTNDIEHELADADTVNWHTVDLYIDEMEKSVRLANRAYKRLTSSR